MNMMNSIKTAPNSDAFAFDAAVTRDEWQALEEISRSFGVNRRIIIGLATQNRAEMTDTLAALNEEAGLDDILDTVTNYREHLDQMVEFTKMVEARIIVSCHAVLGLPFDETCPK